MARIELAPEVFDDFDRFFDHMAEFEVEDAPQRIREILERVARRIQNVDGPAVVVASTGARYFLRQLLEPSFKNAFVLSHSEIPPGTKVTSLGVI